MVYACLPVIIGGHISAAVIYAGWRCCSCLSDLDLPHRTSSDFADVAYFAAITAFILFAAFHTVLSPYSCLITSQKEISSQKEILRIPGVANISTPNHDNLSGMEEKICHFT